MSASRLIVVGARGKARKRNQSAPLILVIPSSLTRGKQDLLKQSCCSEAAIRMEESGGLCVIIHRGEAGETDGERGCKVQSEQRGALADMNLQRGRPLRGSHTLEQEHWAQRVPRHEEAPAIVFNGGKTTCIINWVPDTELRPTDVPLHRPQPL